jgi:hypothetical protein
MTPTPTPPAPKAPEPTPPPVEDEQAAGDELPSPSLPPEESPAVAAPGAKVRPEPTRASEPRSSIDPLLADGKVKQATAQLRDRIAVAPKDASAHLHLGAIYAEVYHYRRDAFHEFDRAFSLDAALKSDAVFRKALCETVDADQGRVATFLRGHFDADENAALLLACVRATVEPSRIENAARLIEATVGAERPELGMAAMRMLDVGKTCAQKKAAVETIRRLHYLRARNALVKLDRLRLAQKGHPTPAVSCFGTVIAETIEQLK